jgi:leucyl-tRNA---protein transferase
MFGNIHTPTILPKSNLDNYLAKGWFRMGQTIFTCNFLNFKRTFYSAIWLRIDLKKYQPDKAFEKLQKLNAGFRIQIQAATITPRKEELYKKYKTGIAFETSSSLSALLLNDGKNSIYDTHEICIYNQNKLIAVGYFDLGDKSTAGIVSFYEPDYKKYSLGKYLIYSKIAYCAEQGFSYFYPGYFAPNYAMFDYKLSIGKSALEFLNIYNNQWQSFTTFSFDRIPIQEMADKLTLMEQLLQKHQIAVVKLKYEYYNANNIPELNGLELFDYPEFLMVNHPKFEEFDPIIIFDTISQKYRLVKCVSYYYNEAYSPTDDYYGTHLMEISEELLSDADARDFITRLELV